MNENPSAVNERVCTHCGAKNPPGKVACWLCNASLFGDEDVIQAELVPEPPPFVEGASGTLFEGLFLLFQLIVVVGGLALIQPGLAVMLAIVAIPAGIATAVRSGRLKRDHRPTTWEEKAITFLISAAAVAGALSLLAMAACVAFFIWCLVQLPSGMNMH